MKTAERQDNMTPERWQRLRSLLGFKFCACGCGTEILSFDKIWTESLNGAQK